MPQGRNTFQVSSADTFEVLLLLESSICRYPENRQKYFSNPGENEYSVPHQSKKAVTVSRGKCKITNQKVDIKMSIAMGKGFA